MTKLYSSYFLLRKMNFKFKKENSLKNRQLKLQNFKNKFPDRIPLIIQKYKNSTLPEYQKDRLFYNE